jgi:hypothetical protein
MPKAERQDAQCQCQRHVVAPQDRARDSMAPVSPQATHQTGLQALVNSSARMVSQRAMSEDVARSPRVLQQQEQRSSQFGVPAPTSRAGSVSRADEVVQRVPDLQAKQPVRFYDRRIGKVKGGTVVTAHGASYRLTETMPQQSVAAAGGTVLEVDEKDVFPSETPVEHILRELRVPVPDTISGGWLGDAYLFDRQQKRPKQPNDASCGYSENCLLVTVGAIVGRTTTAVASDLGYAVPQEQDALTLVGPEVHDRYENSNAGMKPKAAYVEGLMVAQYGTQEDFIAKEVQGNVDAAAVTAARRKYIALLIAEKTKLAANNDLVLPKAIEYVRQKLENQVNIRFGGSTRELLRVEDGVAAMKHSPPGTQYIVFMEDADQRGDHFVYADNLNAAIRFIDYQPWHEDPSGIARPRVGEHPTSTDVPTPSPNVSEHGKPASDNEFSHICFVAFEPTHAHVLATIKSSQQ